MSERFTDRDGNKAERTEWATVVAFDKTAENCNRFLHKGSLVYVEGRLTTREWQDPTNGQKRTATDIRANVVQFLDPKGRRDPQDAAPAQGAAKSDGYLDDMPF